MRLLLLLMMLLSLCHNPATPPEIPLFMYRLSIAESRSFSDSSSCVVLFVPFVAIISNSAISVAVAFRKILYVSINVTCSIDLPKATDGVSLRAHVAWAEPPQRIPVILAITLVSFLAVATVANDALWSVEIYILCKTVQCGTTVSVGPKRQHTPAAWWECWNLIQRTVCFWPFLARISRPLF